MLSLDRLQAYRQDALIQSNWRWETAKALDYVDGNQFDSTLAMKMEEKGLPLIVVNICKATVETACGILERQQTDAIVLPESDDQQSIADVLSYRMKETERATNADRVCLDAARMMFGGGIGWVEVSRVSDPFAYPYRVAPVPYTEMWVDPRSKYLDYSDAAYMRRMRFFERDALLQAFPQYAPAINTFNSSAGTNGNAWYEPQMYYRSETRARDTAMVALDLWSANRDLTPMEDIQYRVTDMQYVFRLSSGKWIRFDQENPMHMMAYNQGHISLEVRPVNSIRQSYWIGDTCVMDRPSPAGRDRFTYVPFIFEREARTGVPYGPMRNVIPLQDEVNTRRAKAVYSLLSTRVIVSPESVDDLNLLREEIGRRDAMIVLSAKYNKGTSTLEIEDGIKFADKQLEISGQAMELAPQISGVPLSLQGVRDGGVTSGVGIDRLADYGNNALSRPFNHYRAGRRQVFEILLQYTIDDIGTEMRDMRGQNKRGMPVTVSLNVPMQDEDTGMQYVANNISAMDLKVVLDEIPQSATFRQEQLKVFMQALAAVPPDIQAAAIPFVADLLDIPGSVKKELVKTLRARLGYDQEAKTPEEQQALQQQQEAEQAAQAAVQKIQVAAQAAKTRRDNAAAGQSEATAAKTAIETQLLVADHAKTPEDKAAEHMATHPPMPKHAQG